MKGGRHPALAQGKVRYVGDSLAVVIAETLDQAKDATHAIKVDYGVLPAVADLAKARDAGAAQIHENAPRNTIYEWVIGDEAAVDAAIKRAKHVTKIDIVNNRLIPNAMEPRAAIGEYDQGTESFTLWTTSQNPHVARLVLSAFIGIAPEHKFRVIAPDVGGGFGSKIFIYPEETVCIWASKKVGRPVRWTADRSESFQADAHGRDHITHAELAVDERGKITALKVKTLANIGSYMSTFSSAVPTFLYAPLLSGQYEIPSIYCEVDGVFTNTAPVDAYRGAGRPEACFVIERIVEVAARELGIDPAEFRKKNFIKSFPYQTPVASLYDAGDYPGALDKALQQHDYKGFGKRKAESERNGKLRGIGFSSYIEACGVAPSAVAGSLGCGVGLWESAEVRGDTHRHGGSAHRQPQPRPGPRDDLRAARVGQARHSHGPHHDRPWRHRQGAVRHGHLRLALGRGRHVGHRQGDGKGRGQGQEDRRASAGSRRGRHRIQRRQVQGRRHRQGGGLRRDGLAAYARTNSAAAAWSPA